MACIAHLSALHSGYKVDARIVAILKTPPLPATGSGGAQRPRPHDLLQTDGGVIVSNAGTTFSDRHKPEHPNAFNVITGDRNELSLRTMSWQNGDFESAGKQPFVRLAGGRQHTAPLFHHDMPEG